MNNQGRARALFSRKIREAAGPAGNFLFQQINTSGQEELIGRSNRHSAYGSEKAS
ncbi:hypothetical protein RSC2_02760 [Bacillus paralicheniformis]|nr:hypothetical protein RSC1_00918 [Bacillus paralicheniformis]BCE10964.1 hypothetical protein RSC2_02760 [Bacillus paralicheniformis]BCE17199.1 hypothetical protein RSC3_04555 [Bacillus paralicheniformis]